MAVSSGTLKTHLVALALAISWTNACQREKHEPQPRAQSNPSASASAHSSTLHPKDAPLANERIEIPQGAFEAGSLPGTEGRCPQIEQLLTTVELGPYQIDRLPFPNDPAFPPLTNVTRIEALARCAERGARLCTELEWERACKGPSSDLYSTGATFEMGCGKTPYGCGSGFNVLGLGTSIREWTGSNVVAEGNASNRGASVRGAGRDAPGPGHRCAAREAVRETDRAPNLGFRCCHGPLNAIRVEEPHQKAVFERPPLDQQAITKLLESEERTKPLAKEFVLFREPEAAETVVSRGPGDRQGLKFTVLPLIWSPVAGARYLLVTGRSGKDTSFVLAYHVISDSSYRLASSFVMRNEPGPVAFAYHESIRPRLFFSTCWRCPGETGKILHRDPDSVVLVQP